jgi:urea transport system substrate-binding protein
MKQRSYDARLFTIQAAGVITTVLSLAICIAAPTRMLAQSQTVEVGVLHSLSGTMAISEDTVKNSTLLAIDQINASGGVLGKKIVPVIEDGASDPAIFSQKAQKLIQEDKVVTVFGGWTSASRKAMLPVFERFNSLLWYPVQFEGNECSSNIMYSGAQPNQQILPALDYAMQSGKKKVFLLGSDYVFPRTANLILKKHIVKDGGVVSGEEYVPLGGTDFSAIITKIKIAKPDVVFSSWPPPASASSSCRLSPSASRSRRRRRWGHHSLLVASPPGTTSRA